MFQSGDFPILVTLGNHPCPAVSPAGRPHKKPPRKSFFLRYRVICKEADRFLLIIELIVASPGSHGKPEFPVFPNYFLNTFQSILRHLAGFLNKAFLVRRLCRYGVRGCHILCSFRSLCSIPNFPGRSQNRLCLRRLIGKLLLLNNICSHGVFCQFKGFQSLRLAGIGHIMGTKNRQGDYQRRPRPQNPFPGHLLHFHHCRNSLRHRVLPKTKARLKAQAFALRHGKQGQGIIPAAFPFFPHHSFIAQKLHIPVKQKVHQPHQRIEPVYAQSPMGNQLFQVVMMPDMHQLMTEPKGNLLFRILKGALGKNNGRTQHAIGYRRRSAVGYPQLHLTHPLSVLFFQQQKKAAPFLLRHGKPFPERLAVPKIKINRAQNQGQGCRPIDSPENITSLVDHLRAGYHNRVFPLRLYGPRVQSHPPAPYFRRSIYHRSFHDLKPLRVQSDRSQIADSRKGQRNRNRKHQPQNGYLPEQYHHLFENTVYKKSAEYDDPKDQNPCR